jgi:hypothetical protein
MHGGIKAREAATKEFGHGPFSAAKFISLYPIFHHL